MKQGRTKGKVADVIKGLKSEAQILEEQIFPKQCDEEIQ